MSDEQKIRELVLIGVAGSGREHDFFHPGIRSPSSRKILRDMHENWGGASLSAAQKETLVQVCESAPLAKAREPLSSTNAKHPMNVYRMVVETCKVI